VTTPSRRESEPPGARREDSAMTAPGVLAPRLEALGEALRRVRRRPLLMLLALALTGSALALMLSGVTLMLALAASWQRLNVPAQAVVFVATSARSADIGALRSRALEVPGVATVEHPSREAMLADLSRRTPGGTPADLRASALPETLLVQFSRNLDPSIAEAAVAALRKLPRVDLVQFDVDAYRRWHGLQRIGATVGLVAAGMLAVLCAGLLMLLPGPFAAVPRDQAQLRSLLGATAADIRRPSVYAGALFGAVSALLGIGALMLGQRMLEPLLTSLPVWAGAAISLTLPPWEVLVAVIAGCMLLAGAAGALAARSSR
jgi:cell division transport system permease protein